MAIKEREWKKEGEKGKRNDTLSNRGLTDYLCGVGYISAVLEW